MKIPDLPLPDLEDILKKMKHNTKLYAEANLASVRLTIPAKETMEMIHANIQEG